MEQSFKKNYMKIAAISMLLFVCTSQFGGLSFYHAAYVQSISFFAFTWYCVYYYEGKGVPIGGVIYSIIGGRYILEVIDRVLEFEGSMVTLPLPFINLACILLGLFCAKSRRPLAYILAIIVVISLNAVVYPLWVAR